MADVRALTWNIFHGRDRPPDNGLFTWRSRLLKVAERNATHVQVNRPLLREFAEVLAKADWSVCLLQETPPPWAQPLAEHCGADAHSVLTSRNQFAPLRRRLAGWNPDLVQSWEGGSNLTLVRGPWRIVERDAVLLNPLPRRGLRERRWMALTALVSDGAELCVANLHATAGNEAQAEADVCRGAERALGFAHDRPLIFGGDLNLRPRSSPVFEELERRFQLAAPTADDAIDHLLVRGLEVLEEPHPWPPEGRELLLPQAAAVPLRLRLSDHAPVEAAFGLPPTEHRGSPGAFPH
jgi:endonuclease/exonuclease/phosphatase family metal-dependent hydrolase